MSRLTTHVLDTAAGIPARGMTIELHSVDDDGLELLRRVETDADGRIAGALLDGSDFRPGRYALTFHVADYFRARGSVLPDPPFLDLVVIRFGIADAQRHWHVPLLVSPWSYSTYRGS